MSRLLTTRRDHLSKADVVMVAAVEAGMSALGTARDLIERFHRMLRVGDADALTPWLSDTGDSMLASFDKGIRADLDAVRAALTEPWSNGQTKGQITKLKLISRQIYGALGLISWRTPCAPQGSMTFDLHRDLVRAGKGLGLAC